MAEQRSAAKRTPQWTPKPWFCGRHGGKSLILKELVPKKGLEPPHPCEYVDLNHARLPIPPLRHGIRVRRGWPDRQFFKSRKRRGLCQRATIVFSHSQILTHIPGCPR